MPALQRTPAASSAAIGMFVLVVVGTIALMRTPDPEQALARAENGGAWLTGVWSPQAQPRLDPSPREGALTAVRGLPYRITAPTARPGHPYILSLAVPQDVSLKEAVLYWEDVSIGGWRAVPAAPSADAWTLETVVDALPTRTWAVGVSYTPTPSAHAFAALRSLAAVPPPGAVGYRAAYLSATAPMDYVVVQDPFGSGGCEGRFQSGTEQTKTSLDASETERVVIVWELGAGCAPGTIVSPVVRDPS